MKTTCSTMGRRATVAGVGLSMLLLAACGGAGTDAGAGGGGGRSLADLRGLNQALYEPGTSRYVYGLAPALPQVRLANAPADADASRWAMLHDGVRYRLYCFRIGSDDVLYQFGYDPATQAYEYGFDSIPQVRVAGRPPTADPTTFAMLHDGADYRLYMRDGNDPRILHQWAFDAGTGRYEYGYRSIAQVATSNAPGDADFGCWAMLHDGRTYRQYVGRVGSPDELYQFGFDGRTYELGHDSIPALRVVDMPPDGWGRGFAMLHDGSRYRYYRLGR